MPKLQKVGNVVTPRFSHNLFLGERVVSHSSFLSASRVLQHKFVVENEVSSDQKFKKFFFKNYLKQ